MRPATSGAQWRRGIDVELPSGNIVYLRAVDVGLWQRMGGIPDVLTDVVEHMLKDEEESEAKPLTNLEDFAATRKLMETFAAVAFVSPRVVENPTAEDEISAADIALEDLQFVFSLLNQTTDALRRFSKVQQGANLVTVVAQPGDLPPAK